MIPDPLKKMVKIPVKIRNGNVEFFYGGPLPEFQAEVIGDLFVPSSSLKDQSVLAVLTSKYSIEILPEKTVLLGQMSVLYESSLFDPKMEYLRDVRGKYQINFNQLLMLAGGLFAEIELRSPLTLSLRGTKEATLEECKCFLPFLKVEALSINHSYTLLSTAFEVHRRSHTGNVFDKVFYLKNNERWFPLRELRDQKQRELEEKYSKSFES